MKLVFNFQVGHTQLVYTTYKYIPVYTHLSQITSGSECWNLHTQVIELTGMKSIWVHESSRPVQTNEQWCSQTHDWYLFVEKWWVGTRLSGLVEIRAAGSVTRDTTRPIAIKASAWGDRSWKHPNNWFLLVFRECRVCNSSRVTFCLCWGNEC